MMWICRGIWLRVLRWSSTFIYAIMRELQGQRLAYIYRVHAIERMFQRDISESDIKECIENGIVIESYKDDKPYPSFLSLYFIESRPIHVVYAYDDEKNVIIITTYVPNNTKWENDFKTRRNL